MPAAMTAETRELPDNLPFHVGDVIGSGAFATVRLAKDLQSSRLYAVKFIDKVAALNGHDPKSSKGQVMLRQIALEVALHRTCSEHRNVIELVATMETPVWRWIAMEFAEGGDLFDKIDPDIGVEEDIAQFYFIQLISAVMFCHSKGVVHRDLKPENLLLDGDGNLKIGDFGLAALFEHNGNTRLLRNVCGSPPYVAPEVAQKGTPYQGPPVDAWSCGVVLFVLLLGNTPWDEPTTFSPEYQYYKAKNKALFRMDPWNRLEPSVMSLIFGLMTIDVENRMTLEQARQHPWLRRPNRMLAEGGYLADPLTLAQRLMEKLQVNLQQSHGIPSPQSELECPFSQPDTHFQSGPVQQYMQHNGRQAFMSSSQPTNIGRPEISESEHSQLSGEPSMSQFTANPHLPESLTQRASRFKDLCPSERLTQFHSLLSRQEILDILFKALHAQNIFTPPISDENEDIAGDIRIPIRHTDKRKCPLQGEVRIMRYNRHGVWVVKFTKNKGDPLEFRRFFKVPSPAIVSDLDHGNPLQRCYLCSVDLQPSRDHVINCLKYAACPETLLASRSI